MLDSVNVEKLVADLMPSVTEDIWIGKMNHIAEFGKDANGELKKHLDLIEKEQTIERIATLHKAFEGNPKVKWKTGTLESESENGESGFKSSNKKSKATKWPLVKINNEAGEEVNATAPLIVSASRRNDIPAHYAEWFMAGLRRGHLGVKFPKPRYIAFNDTKFITFWTKNPAPMFQYLDELDGRGIHYYFTYTLNDYEKEGLEPNVPALQKRIETFQALSNRIGKKKVIWRFDPLILSDVITREALIEKVGGLFPRLSPHTEKLVISFLKAGEHKKVERNLKKAKVMYRDFSQEDIVYVAQAMGALGKEHGIQVMTCAEASDLSLYGIGKNRCIDGALLRRISSDDPKLMKFLGDGVGPKDKGQRPLCGCLPSVDVGVQNTCQHLCHYCYANVSEKAVKANLERMAPDGEFLVSPKKEPA